MAKTTQTTDIAAEVTRVIETAPSLPALNAATKRLSELGAQHGAIQAEINQLTADLNAGRDASGARARDLLETGKLATDTISESLSRARRGLAVVASSVLLQSSTVRELRGKVTSEVQKALKVVRLPLIERTSAALRELQEVASEDGKVLAEVTRGGFDQATIGGIGFAPVSAWGTDQAWLTERRAQGYTV